MRYSITTDDWKKVGRGFIVALAGAALAWVVAELVPTLETSADPRVLLLAAVLSATVNALRKWLA